MNKIDPKPQNTRENLLRGNDMKNNHQCHTCTVEIGDQQHYPNYHLHKREWGDQITSKIAALFVWYGRGGNLTNVFFDMFKIAVYMGILADLSHRYLGVNIPIKFLPPFIISYVVAMTLIGWLDTKIGIYKKENNYRNKTLTPFFEEMSEGIKRIENKIK